MIYMYSTAQGHVNYIITMGTKHYDSRINGERHIFKVCQADPHNPSEPFLLPLESHIHILNILLDDLQCQAYSLKCHFTRIQFLSILIITSNRTPQRFCPIVFFACSGHVVVMLGCALFLNYKLVHVKNFRLVWKRNELRQWKRLTRIPNALKDNHAWSSRLANELNYSFWPY